jgi:hypothetical protein
MTERQFEVGERVQARGAGLVPSGTRGTIHEAILAPPQDMYYVWFDDSAEPCLMHKRDLELADDALPDRGRATGAD